MVNSGECCSRNPTSKAYEDFSDTMTCEYLLDISNSTPVCRCSSCSCKEKLGRPCSFTLPSLKLQIGLPPGLCVAGPLCEADPAYPTQCGHSRRCALRDVGRRLKVRVPAVRSLWALDLSGLYLGPLTLAVEVRYSADGEDTEQMKSTILDKCRFALVGAGYRSVDLYSEKELQRSVSLRSPYSEKTEFLASESSNLSNSFLETKYHSSSNQSINQTGRTKTTLVLHGLTCSSCVSALDGMIRNLEGVEKVSSSVTVTLLPQKAIVYHYTSIISSSKIALCIEDAGYEVLKLESEDATESQPS
ncbi:hypothetical protein HK096_005816 [Nowakowskiella sp. JEL0078]|nr:hypothetical protein HK096_005816 [Nowakowskiella sp. JEL0078]